MPERMPAHAVVFLQAEDPTRLPIPRDNNKGLVPCCALTNLLGYALWKVGSLFHEKIAFAICEMASSVLDGIRDSRMPSGRDNRITRWRVATAHVF
jgi:hypothetical protein